MKMNLWMQDLKQALRELFFAQQKQTGYDPCQQK